MTTPQSLTIPLNQLTVSEANVRKIGGTHIKDLAAMIAAQGLLHRLTVTPSTRGKTKMYEVVAGKRRLTALLYLASKKKLAKDAPIECLVIPAEQAVAASLTENIGREAMHPADQFLAFKALIDEGKSAVDVAAAFGTTEITVTRRLKLAQVSPRLFELYRKDKMSLEQLMAFTLTDDHAKQEQVWKSAADFQRAPHHLRDLLTEGELSVTDPLVQFVGVSIYQDAGGTLRSDLFSEQNEGYLTDTAKLNELALAKLETIAEPYRTAGWKWVECRPHFPYSDRGTFQTVTQGYREPAAKEQAQIDLLKKAVDDAQHECEANDDEALEEALYDTLSKAEDALDRFMQRLVFWSPEQLAQSGVVVTVAHDGKSEVYAGLVRPEDQKAVKRVAQARALAAGDSDAVKAEHSEGLTRALTAHRNAALQALLVQHPHIALVTLVHSLVLQCFAVYQTRLTADPLKIRATTVTFAQRTAAPDMEHSAAGVAFNAAWVAWEPRLPKDGNDLFAWLLSLSATELQSLLTLCVAASLDTMATKDVKGLPGAALASALSLDMADWWQPTAEGYLKRVSKAQILGAVAAAKSAEDAKKLPAKSKAELVTAAEIALRGTRWLPNVLKP